MATPTPALAEEPTLTTPALKQEDTQEEPPPPPPVPTHLVDELYDKCAEQPKDTIFFQRELSNMQVAESMEQLLQIVQGLVNRHLMKPMTLDGEICWQLRSRSDAEKLRRLTSDERNLYNHIDQTQNEGIWSKALRVRANVTTQVLTRCLKSLETKDLVQVVLNVKNPSRKMYLLKHLEPAEEIAGGIWQNNGDFDVALVEATVGVVKEYVEAATVATVHPHWNDYAKVDRSAAIAHKKAQVQAVRDIEDAPPRLYRPPMRPHAYKVHKNNAHYPTAASVAEHVNSIGFIKNKRVRESDMEQLLEMMVLHGTLEKVNLRSYRTVLSGTDDKAYNGFVDAPCGTCPVFDLCIDEGDITARTCAYFATWLDSQSEEI